MPNSLSPSSLTSPTSPLLRSFLCFFGFSLLVVPLTPLVHPLLVLCLKHTFPICGPLFSIACSVWTLLEYHDLHISHLSPRPFFSHFFLSSCLSFPLFPFSPISRSSPVATHSIRPAPPRPLSIFFSPFGNHHTTMSASATLTISNLWTTGPSDLKRRHTRGNTAVSQTSTRFHSTVPATVLSGKNHGSFEDDYIPCRDDGTPSSSAHAAINSKGQSRAGGATRVDMDSTDKSSVPSWFGSLRSFAISASSSSRGAFTPLLPPTGPKSSRSKCKSKSNYSLSSSSSSSGSLGRSRSRGRSSSIYYANTLDDPDSDGDGDSDGYQDEPVTSKNGLKENRVRGPRTSWALLDPTLGGILPQSYKVVPGSEPEPELSSPSSSSDSSCESSLPSPASLSNVESLAISETRYHRDTDDDDAFEEGYGAVDDSHENDLVSKRPRSKTSSSGSAFSLIKSYVPSLPTFTDSGSGSTAAAEKRSSGTGGLWSMRRLSMNLLSSNQYAQLDTSKTANSQERSDRYVEVGERSVEEEGEEEEEEGNTQGYYSYKDDDMLCGQGKVDPQKRSRGSSFRKERNKPAGPISPKASPVSPSSTSSYFASMLSSASSAVSSKGSKAKKTGRME
ncbi:unnamed protein product [Mortierella alpina]